MRDRFCISLLVLGLVCTGTDAAEQRMAEADRIAGLIGQLGGPRFAEREAAMRALEEIGGPALPALRRALRASDPEVRRRAGRLVRQIERRLETARLLAGQRVRLVCRDTPLREALADLGKRAGAHLDLAGDRAALARQRITLETGEVSFWEAFDRLCGRAGLVEKEPPPVAAAENDFSGYRRSVVILGAGQRQATDVLRPAGDDKPLTLYLKPGKPAPLPTCYAGAVRIRALAPSPQSPAKDEKEIMSILEVSVEPRLRWQRAIDLRVHKALDDQGQVLKPLPVSLKPPAAEVPRSGIWVRGMPLIPAEDLSAVGPRQLPVRLHAGAKPSRRLRELTGTLLIQVRTAAEPLVRVDNVLAAAGRTVRGDRGGSVRIVEIKRREDQVSLRLQVEAAPRGLSDGSAPILNATVILDGKVVSGGEESLNANHFALLDEKGKPFRVVKAVSTGKRAGAAQEYELTYQSKPGQGKPAQFLYRDRRLALVEVPFTLTDVPLP